MPQLDKPCKDSWRAKNKDGYHAMHEPTYGYSTEHRYIYAKAYGGLREGEVVRHKCDNPWCVELSHLELGTQTDNVQDSVDRKRHKNPSFKGSTNPMTGLSENEVLEIREMASKGYTYNSIGLEYNINRVTVSNIVSRKTWKHI